jgi:hypothetical protein
VALAKQAAHMSKLNVGIACNGDEGEIVLHHRELASERPLFKLAIKDADKAQLRQLGINAARLVKGEPLVFREDVPPDSAMQHPVTGTEMDSKELLDLIVRIVLELLAKE